MNSAFKTPRRISVTVPFAIYDQLAEKSDLEGRSVSNLAAYLLEAALSRLQEPEPKAVAAARPVVGVRFN
jgi:transcription initiation factor TFIIIB Brf1 subunit/transcription initiation factor TFIIB